MPGPGEQTDLGKLEIVVGADRRGIVDAHKRGGEAAAESFVRGSRRGADQFASAGLSSIGLTGGGAARAGGAGIAAAAAGGGAVGLGARAGLARFLPLAAVAAGAALVTSSFVKLARASGRLVRQADDEIGRLARVSPGLSAIQVRSDVNQLLRDLGRARLIERDLIGLRRSIERTKNNLQGLSNAFALAKTKVAGLRSAAVEGLTENLIGKLIVGLVAPQSVIKKVLEDIRDAVKKLQEQGADQIEEQSMRDANAMFLRDLDALTGRSERNRPSLFSDPIAPTSP